MFFIDFGIKFCEFYRNTVINMCHKKLKLLISPFTDLTRTPICNLCASLCQKPLCEIIFLVNSFFVS